MIYKGMICQCILEMRIIGHKKNKKIFKKVLTNLKSCGNIYI